ncbi:MAG: cyclic nucleotide-binding domain-containing protein [Spirochaetales bacterium]|nr:cyclic nucleotide-binding domain-containing protein [Spirochaetales bacterium]
MKRVLYIFGQLSDSDVEWLINHGKKKEIARGDVLIRQNERTDNIYIILDGIFEVLIGKNERKITDLTCGEIIGEMSFVDSAPTSATVKAAGESVVFVIPKQMLQDKISADTGFAAHFYRAISLFLAERVRVATRTHGFGDQKDSGEIEINGEIDPFILDNISAGGDRFQRMLKRMMAR